MHIPTSKSPLVCIFITLFEGTVANRHRHMYIDASLSAESYVGDATVFWMWHCTVYFSTECLQLPMYVCCYCDDKVGVVRTVPVRSCCWTYSATEWSRGRCKRVKKQQRHAQQHNTAALRALTRSLSALYLLAGRGGVGDQGWPWPSYNWSFSGW